MYVLKLLHLTLCSDTKKNTKVHSDGSNSDPPILRLKLIPLDSLSITHPSVKNHTLPIHHSFTTLVQFWCTCIEVPEFLTHTLETTLSVRAECYALFTWRLNASHSFPDLFRTASSSPAHFSETVSYIDNTVRISSIFLPSDIFSTS